MSWDAVIIKGPKPSSVEFQQDNFNAASLGELQNVIDQIKKSIPNVQIEQAHYLLYQENELRIEIDINCKDDNKVKELTISVRGNGNPIEIITKLCKENDWEIFDMQEAEFIDLNNPNAASWFEFTKFREKVVQKYTIKWWEFWKYCRLTNTGAPALRAGAHNAGDVSVINKIKKDIKKYGWSYIYVFDTKGDHDFFGYTIGLEKNYRHPEIIIIGLSQENTHGILSNIVENISKGATYETAKLYGQIIGNDFKVKFTDVRTESFPDYLGQACNYYKNPFRALVMLWPDKQGFFPDENGYSLKEQMEALTMMKNKDSQ